MNDSYIFYNQKESFLAKISPVWHCIECIEEDYVVDQKSGIASLHSLSYHHILQFLVTLCNLEHKKARDICEQLCEVFNEMGKMEYFIQREEANLTFLNEDKKHILFSTIGQLYNSKSKTLAWDNEGFEQARINTEKAIELRDSSKQLWVQMLEILKKNNISESYEIVKIRQFDPYEYRLRVKDKTSITVSDLEPVWMQENNTEILFVDKDCLNDIKPLIAPSFIDSFESLVNSGKFNFNVNSTQASSYIVLIDKDFLQTMNISGNEIISLNTVEQLVGHYLERKCFAVVFENNHPTTALALGPIEPEFRKKIADLNVCFAKQNLTAITESSVKDSSSKKMKI